MLFWCIPFCTVNLLQGTVLAVTGHLLPLLLGTVLAATGHLLPLLQGTVLAATTHLLPHPTRKGNIQNIRLGDIRQESLT
jgi:hypothetical protein